MGLWTFGLLVFLLNAAFGYWRASVRKASRLWMLALLLPGAFVIALRYYSGLDFTLKYAAVVGVTYVLGQVVGGRLRNIIQGRGPGRSHG